MFFDKSKCYMIVLFKLSYLIIEMIGMITKCPIPNQFFSV